MPGKTTTPRSLRGLLAFDYNIRGWLLGINRDYVGNTVFLNQAAGADASTTGGETYSGPNGSPNYFGFELAYDKNLTAGGSSFAGLQYSGNISGMAWKGTNDMRLRKYDYAYDAVSRLTSATFGQYTTGSYTNQYVNFSTTISGYDANGNIGGMAQKGLALGTNAIIDLDVLTYNYVGGTNRLQQVVDAGNNASTSTLGDFKYAPGVSSKPTNGTDYGYDANGNLTSDANKQITGIAYNYLNLPITVSTAKGAITYIYDAIGNKLQKTTVETSPSSLTTVTTYVSGFVYQNDVLQSIPQEEGRIRIVGSTTKNYAFDYFLKDNLGNTRMVITDDYTYSNVVVEWTNYYAGGLAIAGISGKASTAIADNKFRYNGKELQSGEFSDGSGLDTYDYSARGYDPQLMRFDQIDPHAGNSSRWSPYVYCYNNPMRFVDPDGMDGEDGNQMVNYVDVQDKNGNITHVITGDAAEGTQANYTDLRDGQGGNGSMVNSYTYSSSNIAVNGDGSPNAYNKDNGGILQNSVGGINKDGKTGARYGIAHNGDDNYVQGPLDPKPGGYISTTKLEDKIYTGLGDVRRYVNAETIEYVTQTPEMKKNGIGMGTLGLATNIDNGNTSFFIVADSRGNDNSLEMSIKMCQTLNIAVTYSTVNNVNKLSGCSNANVNLIFYNATMNRNLTESNIWMTSYSLSMMK